MNIFELFAKLSLDAGDYENGLNNAEKQTKSFGEKMSSGLKTAGKIGVAAIGAVTAVTAALSKKMLDGAKQAAAYGDAIDKQSQKMGISAQAYQEWDAILQHSGASIDSLQRGMVTLSKAAENQSDAFEKLGLSQEQVASMNQEELFAATIAGLQRMEEGTERTAIASQLLGGSAKELGALLNTSAEDTEKMRQRVHELGGVMSDEAVKAAAAYQDSLQDLTTAFAGIKRGLYADFLPAITTVMDGLTELFAGNGDKGLALINQGVGGFVDNLVNIIPKIAPVAAQIVSGIGSALLDNIDMLADVGVDLIIQLTDGIVKALPKIVKSGVQIIKSIAQAISRNIKPILKAVTSALVEIIGILTDPGFLPDLIQAGLDMLMALVDGLLDALPQLIAAVPPLITGFINAIVANLPMIIDCGIQLIKMLIDGLIENLPALMDAAIEIILALVDALTNPDTIIKLAEAALQLVIAIGKGLIEALPTLIEKVPKLIMGLYDALIANGVKLLKAGRNIIDNIANGIDEKWDDVKQWAKDITGKIGESFLKTWETVKTWGKDIIDKIRDGISTKWPEVKTWAVSVIAKIGDGLLNVWEDVKRIGKDIVRGIWEGIKSMASWIGDQVSGFFSGLIGDAKAVLGISSPSKVFASIGAFTAEGFGLGFDKAFAGVADDVQSQMDALTHQTVSIDGKGSTSGMVGTLNKVEALLTEIRDKDTMIVLDDGTIVGRVDKMLGQTTMWKARGNA